MLNYAIIGILDGAKLKNFVRYPLSALFNATRENTQTVSNSKFDGTQVFGDGASEIGINLDGLRLGIAGRRFSKKP